MHVAITQGSGGSIIWLIEVQLQDILPPFQNKIIYKIYFTYYMLGNMLFCLLLDQPSIFIWEYHSKSLKLKIF
jgi:hypothetical protein